MKADRHATASKSNEAIVRQYVDLSNAHDYDGLGGVLANTFKLRLGNDALDREQTFAITKAVFAAFPDFTQTIEDIFSMDDRVVIRMTDRGTHSDEFQGIAATGRKIEIGMIAIYRVADGRIVEAWEQADLAGLLQQIQGPAPADASTAATL